MLLALVLSLVLGMPIESKRMADGREWTTANLNVTLSPSFCYDDAEANCQRYGRLYPWASAQRACRSLGAGWRLPTSGDWQQLAKPYGGMFDDSTDRGAAAYAALMTGGRSGFNAVLGGGRNDGSFGRLEAHGFYWTASETDPTHADFYNFGKGSHALYHQPGGDKESAFAVRCVKD
jgi:uncharacterized protein (TIGR02145 family)